MTMTVTVVHHTTRDVQVHRPGCADIAREQARGHVNNTWDTEVEGKDVAAEVAAILCDDFGDPDAWQARHIKVLPCVHGGSRFVEPSVSCTAKEERRPWKDTDACPTCGSGSPWRCGCPREE